MKTDLLESASRKSCAFVGLSMARPLRFCRMVWTRGDEYSFVSPGDAPFSEEQESVDLVLPGSPGRAYIPSHSHEFYEITLVFKGHVVHRYGEQQHTLKAGDVLVLGPAFTHAFEEIEQLEKVNFYLQPQWLAEDLRVLWSETGLIRFLLADALFSFGASDCFLMLHSNPDELAVWAREVDELMSEAAKPTPSLAFYNACFLKILKVLDSAYRRAGYGTELPYRSEIWGAIQEIEKMISRGKRFSTSELAAAVGMSRRPFSELFQSAAGMLASDYYQRRRIEHSLPLLADPSMSVTDVAYCMGFSDSAYFSRVFSKIKGVSPNAYRVRMLSENGPVQTG